MRKLGFALGALLVVAPAWAINKCTVDGRVIFQDAPCAAGTGGRIEVKPASGSAVAPSATPSPAPTTGGSAAAAAAPKLTEAQRLEGVLANSQASRRRIDLEALLVPDARAALEQTRTGCDAEMAALRAQKSRANNNLAGATWESALSQEMQAVATRCDTRQREQRDELEALRKECIGLGGCKQL